MSVNILKMNRGDTLSFDFTVRDMVNAKYSLNENDTVYFAVMFPHQKFEEAIILKGYTKEDQNSQTKKITIELTPSDTLLLSPGIYYYTIKLKNGGRSDVIKDLDDVNSLRTLFERTKLIINE